MSAFAAAKAPDSIHKADTTSAQAVVVNIPRLAPFPDRFDIGEQIVGSEHEFLVVRPALMHGDGRTAVIATRILPSTAPASPFKSQLGLDPGPVVAQQAQAFSLVDSGIPNIVGVTNQPIRVRVAPKAPGAHRAQLHIQVEWNDGVRDVHVIQLFASARAIDQLPSEPLLKEGPSRIEPPSAPPDSEPRGSLNRASPEHIEALRDLANRASDAAGGIARRQEQGVKNAEEQAKSYKKRPPQSSLLMDLAQMAISMGVAGLAGAIARHLGPLVATLLNNEPSDELVAGMTDTVKDGFKSVAKKALSSPPSPEKSATPEAEYSTNKRIQFFAAQSALLLEVEDANKNVVGSMHERLRKLVATDPELAFDAMKALTEAIVAVRDTQAIFVQQQASERQWVAAVAISGLGAERVFDPAAQQHRTVSKTREAKVAASGMINIDVELSITDETVAAPNVVGATLTGVSQEIADNLRNAPLLQAGVPVMLIVKTSSSTAWITRDEAGRIRLRGYLPNSGGEKAFEEAQMHQNATLLAEKVLAKSLRDWGVAEVETNDATRREDHAND